VTEKLRSVGLRPTRQRIALGCLLFGGAGTSDAADRDAPEGAPHCHDRHVTAEQLHSEADRAGVKVSVATVYNTLHQFTDCGLLREVVVEAGRSYFDTNTDRHHHFFETDTGRLIDIENSSITINGLPEAPGGTEIERVDLVVRVRRSG
jgi:Fur family iron response transcriptional regulator